MPRRAPRVDTTPTFLWTGACAGAFVCVAVVAPAFEFAVVEVRWAAVGPVHDVMDLAVRGGHVATRLGTAAVARFERPAKRFRRRAGRATHVQHLRAALREDPVHVAVAGETAKRFRGNGTNMGEVAAQRTDHRVASLGTE